MIWVLIVSIVNIAGISMGSELPAACTKTRYAPVTLGFSIAGMEAKRLFVSIPGSAKPSKMPWGTIESLPRDLSEVPSELPPGEKQRRPQTVNRVLDELREGVAEQGGYGTLEEKLNKTVIKKSNSVNHCFEDNPEHCFNINARCQFQKTHGTCAMFNCTVFQDGWKWNNKRIHQFHREDTFAGVQKFILFEEI